MIVFLLTLGIFAIALTGMSVGVIFSRRCRIRGSCGGVSGLKDRHGRCEGCVPSAPACGGSHDQETNPLGSCH